MKKPSKKLVAAVRRCHSRMRRDAAKWRKSKDKKTWKDRVRQRPVEEINPHKLYGPVDVSPMIGLGYDATQKRMQKMKGVMDLGMPETRYKKPHHEWRIRGKDLIGKR
jgi:hypothetical protein